jgi:hypothetical protein
VRQDWINARIILNLYNGNVVGTIGSVSESTNRLYRAGIPNWNQSKLIFRHRQDQAATIDIVSWFAAKEKHGPGTFVSAA